MFPYRFEEEKRGIFNEREEPPTISTIQWDKDENEEKIDLLPKKKNNQIGGFKNESAGSASSESNSSDNYRIEFDD